MNEVPTYRSDYVLWSFFISGFVWIFYSLFLFYLFSEHHRKHRFPQNMIVLLLGIGAVLRTIWFFMSPYYYDAVSTLALRIVNRSVILLQFTALSILILMWARAVKVIPKEIHKLSKRSNYLTNQHEIDASAERFERHMLLYSRITILINICAWGLILGSISDNRQTWYHINNIMLSTLCLLEAVVILVVGINTGLKLQREMLPVYVNSSGTPTNSTASKKPRFIIISVIRYIYSSNSGNRGLQIQRQVLRTLLTTAFILSICFLLRSLIWWFNIGLEK